MLYGVFLPSWVSGASRRWCRGSSPADGGSTALPSGPGDGEVGSTTIAKAVRAVRGTSTPATILRVAPVIANTWWVPLASSATFAPGRVRPFASKRMVFGGEPPGVGSSARTHKSGRTELPCKSESISTTTGAPPAATPTGTAGWPAERRNSARRSAVPSLSASLSPSMMILYLVGARSEIDVSGGSIVNGPIPATHCPPTNGVEPGQGRRPDGSRCTTGRQKQLQG